MPAGSPSQEVSDIHEMANVLPHSHNHATPHRCKIEIKFTVILSIHTVTFFLVCKDTLKC